MSDEKRLNCRFFRLVSTKRAQRADPSELGFLSQRTFVFPEVAVESLECAGWIVELGQQKPAQSYERGAPFRTVRIARVSRAISIGRLAKRALRSQRARATEQIAHRCSR